MKNSLFKDANGNYSSKRVFGAIIIVYTMLQSTFDGFAQFSINETIAIAQLSIGATLLGLETITDIWKK